MSGLLKKSIVLTLGLICFQAGIWCQSDMTRITGRVSDRNGNALPLATIRIDGTSTGCTSDQKGYFSFIASALNKTLTVSSVGYTDRSLLLTDETSYPLQIILDQAVYDIEEVVIKPGKEKYVRKGNPALMLIQSVIDSIGISDPFNEKCLSRNRHEHLTLAIDGFDETMQNNMIFRKFPFLKEYTDTSLISGKPILNISDRQISATEFFRTRPDANKQLVYGKRWVGVEDFLPDEEIRASLDATMCDIDLFHDKVIIMRREFTSPFSKIAPSYYNYYIADTVRINGNDCIDLAFIPRISGSFGFTGHIYLTCDQPHSIKWVQMNVPYDINLNFVEHMKIEQIFESDSNGRRILTKESITCLFRPYKFTDAIYALREVNYSDYLFNDDVSASTFDFEENIIEDKSYQFNDSVFWNSFYESHESLSYSDKSKQVSAITEMLRKSRPYRVVQQTVNLLFTGFIPVTADKPKFYIGPINTWISSNGMEDVRIKFGGMTSAALHPRLFATSYLIYGTEDRRFKYFERLEYSFNRKNDHWNEFPIRSLRLQYENDIYQYGQQYLYTNKDNALLSLRRRPDNMTGYVRNAELTYTNERYNGLTYTAVLRHRTNEATRFIPMVVNDGSGNKVSEISQTELEFGLRFAPHESFVQKKWDRIPKAPQYPVFTLNHSISGKGILGSDYSIQHTEFSYRQRLMLGPAGRLNTMVRAGRIWGQVPYPLLIIPNANLSYTYRKESFETMDPMEFVVDKHLTWDFVYHAEGILFNRIPLVSSLNLREVLFCRGIWGSLDDRNNPNLTAGKCIFKFPQSNVTQSCNTLNGTPFIEIGAGIENIFKFVTVGWFKRVTYTDTPGVDQWGIRIAVEAEY